MSVTLDHESKRVSAFFSNLLHELGNETTQDTVAVCIAHILPTAPAFLTALNEVVPIAVLMPKPKSKDSKTVSWAKRTFKCEVLSPDHMGDFSSALIKMLQKFKYRGKSIVLIDIGGYFAPVLNEINDALSGSRRRLLGVMEGTENGAQEYERIFPVTSSDASSSPPVPVLTVARSPLKLPEDYLVGAGIVFSIESILRKHGQILQTRSACVLGFGRVGSAVAASLRGRGIPTIVNDKNAVKMAEAAAQGYQVYPNPYEAVSRSSLIVSATSAAALDERLLASIRSGAAVATVTSKDTEFSNKGKVLGDNYNGTPLSPANVVRYDEKGGSRYFWLLNDGDAPNFLDGAVLGPALQLIEGEKIAAVSALIAGADHSPLGSLSKLRQVTDSDREVVAKTWNDHFIGT